MDYCNVKRKATCEETQLIFRINQLIEQNTEYQLENSLLKQRIDNALCILNELYDCDIKEEDYILIHLAIKTLRGSDKE